MYALDNTGEVFFDEEKGLLIIEGDPGTTVQLQQQQRMILKSLCEHAGKVVTYSNLFRATHDELTFDLGDSQSVAHSVQDKICAIRKALREIGVENASQLLATNRSAGGYEIHLPSGSEEFRPRSTDQLEQVLEDPDSKEISEKCGAADSEHAAFMRRNMLENASPLTGAEVDAYYSEPPGNPIPKSRVVRSQGTGDGNYLFEFEFSYLGYKPRFASIAFGYWEDVNLREYLTYDPNAAFCFDINNEDNVLSALTVEFKTGERLRVFREVNCKLEDGENSIRIPLALVDIAPLSKISEICFVIHPDTTNSFDGSITIGNIRVEYNEKSLS